MSLTLESQPIRTVNGIESNVCAMVSQIPYKFKRQDYTAITVNNSIAAGFVNLVFTNDGIIENTTEGSLFYVEFAGTYATGFYTVPVGGVVLGAGITTIIIDELTYISSTTANVNDLNGRVNYSVEITVYESDGTTELLENPIRYKPKQTGELFVDLSGLIVGKKSDQIETQFIVKYAEVYNGTTQTPVTLDVVIGTLGRKQYLDEGGSTMWEYLANDQDRLEVDDILAVPSGLYVGQIELFVTDAATLLNYSIGEKIELNYQEYKGIYEVAFTDPITNISMILTDPIINEHRGSGNVLTTIGRLSGRFLTDFERPKVWEGWGRSISYALDDDLTARTGETGITVEAVNKNRAGATLSTYDATETTTGIKHFQLQTTSGTDTQDVSMFVSPSTYLSKTVTFDQEQPCSNPVMLEWVNHRGGLEQHLFEVNQSVNLTINEGVTFNKYVGETLDTVSGSTGRIGFDEVQKITMTAEKLTKNFAKVLASIKNSSILRVWLDKTGTKTIDVIVTNDFTYDYQTNDSLVNYSLTIQLPPNFDLFA